MHKTLQVTAESNHPAKSVYSLISDVLSDVEGWDVNLPEKLEDEREIPDGSGIILDMSDAMDDMIRNGNFPFTLERHLDGHFGESTGSANVTSLKLERDLNIREVIEILSQTGQIEKALNIVKELRVDGDPKAETILAYALAQYAKGWLAETVISETGWFKKGSVSQDEGGIDGYVEGQETQIGSITRWNSKKTQIEKSDRRHLLYQWDDKGNLHVGDPEEMLEVNKKIAKEAGLSATLIRKSATWNGSIPDKVGRSFRYIYW